LSKPGFRAAARRPASAHSVRDVRSLHVVATRQPCAPDNACAAILGVSVRCMRTSWRACCSADRRCRGRSWHRPAPVADKVFVHDLDQFSHACSRVRPRPTAANPSSGLNNVAAFSASGLQQRGPSAKERRAAPPRQQGGRHHAAAASQHHRRQFAPASLLSAILAAPAADNAPRSASAHAFDLGDALMDPERSARGPVARRRLTPC